MSLASIRRGSSLLGVFVFALLLWQIRSSKELLPGALYLCASAYPNLFSLSLISRLRVKGANGILDPEAWVLHSKAYVLLLSGWQLAVIGSINLWPFGLSVSPATVIAGYLLAAAFMMFSYKLVAIADDSKQEGGSRPINYFGRPRSRRMFFCGFVYTPIGLLVAFGIVWSDWRLCPAILRVPQIWTLLAALLAAMSAGLIFQRYRSVERNRTRGGRALATGTLLVIGCATVLQVFLGFNVQMYFLSSVSVSCIAASIYWLSRAKEAGTA
jgi:hypothetical protein